MRRPATATRAPVLRHCPKGSTGTFYPVIITGGPFEFIYGNNNRAVGEAVDISLTPPPDLTPTTITTPDAVVEGDRIDISWTVENVGQGVALGSWQDYLYCVLSARRAGTPYRWASWVTANH